MARVLTLKIVNRLVDDSVFFIRTDLGNALYSDPELTRPLLNSNNHDCTGGFPAGKEYDCVSGSTTYYFDIDSGKSLKIYANDGGTFTASVIWAAPKFAVAETPNQSEPNNLIPKGPQRESIGEFTLDASFMNFDVSYVDGVSSAVIMRFESADQSGNIIADQTVGKEITTEPTGLAVQEFAGYPKIWADKFTAPEIEWTGAPGTGITERQLAECPGGDAVVKSKDKPNNQNLCRKWFYDKINDPGSTIHNNYCKWIREGAAGGTGIPAYCWAYDEWKCKNANCGYQPFGNSVADNVLPYYNLPNLEGFVKSQPDNPVNVYSCGFLQPAEEGRPAPSGFGKSGKWWFESSTQQGGCEENLTDGISPAQRVDKGFGGQLTIEFVNVPFISGNSNTPSPGNVQPSEPLNPTYDSVNGEGVVTNRLSVIGIIAIVVGVVLGMVLIYIAIRYFRSGKIIGSYNIRYSSEMPSIHST